MPRTVRYFLMSAVFVVGMSVGTYLGSEKDLFEIENNKESIDNSDEENSNNNIVPLQDVVIRNAQEEKKPEPMLIETVVEETKLSPYAKMVIEKKFTKCGHSSVEVIDVPDELINMTEAEVMEKYKNWELRSFNSKEVSLFREIVANCNDHFVLKEKDGYLAIYSDVTEGTLNLKEVTDIDIASLPSGDVKSLEEGIYVYGQDELSSIIEDFNS